VATIVLTTIHATIEKVDAIDAINLINATNAKKKSVENAGEQIVKKYAIYLYAILVNQTTKIIKTINVYS